MKVAKVDVIRVAHSYEHGTFSTILLHGDPFGVGLEPMDFCNEVGLSRIPAGKYIAIPRWSQKYKHHWHVLDVPNRELILWHPGNVDYNTKGCLLLAQHYGKLRGNLAVLNSGNTYRKFMEATTGKGYTHLHINYIDLEGV